MSDESVLRDAAARDGYPGKKARGEDGDEGVRDVHEPPRLRKLGELDRVINASGKITVSGGRK